MDSDFLEFILMYTTYQSVKESVKIWNLRQLKGLQLQIIFLLNSIISNTKKMQKYLLNTSKCEKFMEKCFINLENLNTLLQQFLKNETVVGLIKFLSLTMQYETNVIEFGKNNVESEVIGLIPAVLRSVLLLSEVSLEAQVKLGNFGVFDPVFELLNDKTQTSEVWKISLLICSSVCKNCEENKVLFGNAEGVNTVISFLNYKSPDIKEEESVLLSVTECIWSAICGNHKNEESFFHLNGIYDLLDLLEIKTSDLRKHLLSCLLDLTEIPKTSFMIMEWRRKTKGKTHQGIEHYLIELWNFEEKHIEISQGDHGVLNNFYSPLIGKNNNKV
ncbi:hypothetical protein HK099_006343 [Clydaea vesicula]|uniref:Cilia- and flagella-associated protein 69 ARM repeats domain-containing protein n=1 Tax=Clydaea vesicula TaxID=447962 RepID=A0AAD5Y0W9_9FUNG|nr:hypothetical protein HK099_006343 [Clydaea vesicula]